MSTKHHLDLSILQKRKDRAGKIIAQCPACHSNGEDSSGEHFVMLPNGRWGCVKHSGDGEHRRRIFEIIGTKERPFPFGSVIVSKTAPKPVDLLARIKKDFAACVYDLWENSPFRCEEDLDDAKAFLLLFPHDAVLWIAPSVRHSGYPEAAQFFRPCSEWQRERFLAPGTRIAPCSFRPGSSSRSRENVAEHLFVVIETDEIGDGQLYANKDEFCSLLRWLCQACGWNLAAVVDSGGKSLHAWFWHPGAADMEKLGEHAAALGLDSKFSEPSQPWRLPGPQREKSDARQQLLYLNLEGKL